MSHCPTGVKPGGGLRQVIAGDRSMLAIWRRHNNSCSDLRLMFSIITPKRKGLSSVGKEYHTEEHIVYNPL
jgi:hypothetical protein